MTRSYDVVVLIENYRSSDEDAIKQAVEDQWDLECPIDSWGRRGDGILEAEGCCSLYANDRPGDFAARIAEGVWRANRGHCDVRVVIVQPGRWADHYVTYAATADDYQSWLQTGELPYLRETSNRTVSLAAAA